MKTFSDLVHVETTTYVATVPKDISDLWHQGIVGDVPNVIETFRDIHLKSPSVSVEAMVAIKCVCLFQVHHIIITIQRK